MIYTKSHVSVQQIHYDQIYKEELQANPVLFYVVTASSFLESTVILYTNNLIEFFKGDKEVTDWLKELWEPEELTHGVATRKYIEHAWPEYDWQKAYDRFYSEYSTYCKVELLRPTRALEMLSRCVTETGSSSMYRAISNFTEEPILKDLMDRMSKDEVKHYSHFYNVLISYDRSEKNSILRKAYYIANRYKVVSHEDLGTALKHVNSGWEKPGPFPLQNQEQILNTLRSLTKEFFPYQMARNMVARTLGVKSFWERTLFSLLENRIKKQLRLIA
jgi:hypothetical protein